ncbi:MAG: thermonuclease family protein [Moraxella sp.]|nr:thermonuclease family protein [Moraxella sp.]
MTHRLICFLFIILLTPAHAAQIHADSVRVIDGDTLEILSAGQSVRVRLQGIDAPESRQDFGVAAKDTLTACATGKVSVHYNKTDRYGRLVGTVFSDEKDCNLAQLENGMAWHYKTYANEQSETERERYAHAENAARTAQKGLWAACATAPWDFRRGVTDCQHVPTATTFKERLTQLWQGFLGGIKSK